MAAAELPELLDLVRESGLVDADALSQVVQSPAFPSAPDDALQALVRAGLLTPFHAAHLANGKYKGFFLGPYKVLRPIARGGMGIVYLAEHEELGRRVAIKVLLRNLPGHVGAEERFRREARAIAALDHPSIVRVHDFGRESDLNYLVLEYVEGKTLERVIQEKGQLPPHVVAGYAMQIAAAVGHAHERGIIHRDIKPANVLLSKGGQIKVLDMGLARFYEDSSDNLTERLGKGNVLGSPDYIAPEQALHRVDLRSDIYSLGATMYAMLMGEPPFPAPTASQKLMAHQVRDVTPPARRDSRVPAEVSRLVVRMMAKRPEERPQGMAEVIEALRPWAERRDEPAAPAAPAAAPPAPRRRPWLAVGAAGAAAAAAVAGWAVYQFVL